MAVVVANTSITANYFKNRLDAYELGFILKELQQKNRGEWERVRWLGFVFSNRLTGEPKKPTGLVTFDWENKETPKIDTQELMTNSLAHFEKIKDKL